MDRPLGRTIGNALEVREALGCLAGGGPRDLRELVTELAAEMTLAGGLVADLGEGRRRAAATLAGGGALERFRRMVVAQGGTVDPARGSYGLPVAPMTEVVTADRQGVVTALNSRALGYGVIPMGGGADPAGPGDRPARRIRAGGESGETRSRAATRWRSSTEPRGTTC